MGKNTPAEPDLEALLGLGADELIADSPKPEDDPLSLIREPQPEPQPVEPVLPAQDEEPEPEPDREPYKHGDVVVFHVVADRVYALDRDLRKGDDIAITIGWGPYRRTIDRFGKSWVQDVDNPEAQIARWGQVRFALGTAEEARQDAVLDQIAVPDFVGEEHVAEWRSAVLDAAKKITT